MNPFSSLIFLKIESARVNVLELAAYEPWDTGDSKGAVRVILKNGEKVHINSETKTDSELMKFIDDAVNHAEQYMLGVAPMGGEPEEGEQQL